MAYVPALLAVAGAAYQGVSGHNAATANRQISLNEQKTSVDQANAQTGMVMRNSRESLGRQEAAFGAAGVGYGGSSERALDQSAINQEWDALDTRYKGSITGYGYGVQANQYGKQAQTYGLLAGSALLKGLGPTYSFAPGAGPQEDGS